MYDIECTMYIICNSLLLTPNYYFIVKARKDKPKGGDNLLFRTATEITILFVLQKPQDKTGEEKKDTSGDPHKRRERTHECPSMVVVTLFNRHNNSQSRGCVWLSEINCHGTLCCNGDISYNCIKILLNPSIQI